VNTSGRGRRRQGERRGEDQGHWIHDSHLPVRQSYRWPLVPEFSWRGNGDVEVLGSRAKLHSQ
jgi:hypothetical protein